MDGLNEAQVEMSARFISQATTYCQTAVFRSTYKAATISDTEKVQLKNCINKYMQGPNIFGPALQNGVF